MRVLHVDTATEWRGGQRQLAYLLAARPDDLWAGVPGSPLASAVRAPDLGLRPGGDPRNLLPLVAPSVDLVAAHTPHALGVAWLTRRPLVVHRRVDFLPRDPWKYRRATGVIAVSEAVAAVLARAGVPQERVVVVPDGVAPPPPGPPVDGPRPLYGAVGALVDHKGHHVLVDAMVGVPGGLVIAGEGPNRAALEARITRLGLGGRVRLLGVLSSPAGLYASVDALVHPSLEEGLGQVVIEAMAAGCRLVATTAGGIPETVGAAAELVPPGDPEALAGAMRRVLARPRGEGIARAEGYTVARMVAGTVAAYERFLGGSVSRR